MSWSVRVDQLTPSGTAAVYETDAESHDLGEAVDEALRDLMLERCEVGEFQITVARRQRRQTQPPHHNPR